MSLPHPKDHPISSLVLALSTALGTGAVNWSNAQDMERDIKTVQDVVKQQAVVNVQIENLVKRQDEIRKEQQEQTKLMNQILLQLK